MAHKLWEKNFEVNKEIERFTVGRDRELDLYLAKYDVLGSMAHITMLESIGLLEKDELTQLLAELKNIYAIADKGEFVIEDGVEDVHSQVELMLTQKLGDMGKKIHSGRSRNDQVLVDLKLFTRHELKEIVDAVKILFDELIQKSNQYKDVLMPGYTHLQVAMPSSFGLWFGAYAEGLADRYQQGGVDVVCAFDDKAIENGPFAGVEGVGSKGYPYFRNRCFVMARKGTDAAKVAELKELYDKILADDEMVEWLNDTMLLEVDTMTEDDVKAHIENVKSIVEQYKDIVAG